MRFTAIVTYRIVWKCSFQFMPIWSVIEASIAKTIQTKTFAVARALIASVLEAITGKKNRQTSRATMA